MQERERLRARLGEASPRFAFLCVEVDGPSALERGEKWVLHRGADLRCFGHAIPWTYGQTLAAGGHQQRGDARYAALRTNACSPAFRRISPQSVPANGGVYTPRAAYVRRHSNDQEGTQHDR